MIEYTIITILSIAVIFQTWRKRTWKRRALTNQLGLWAIFSKSFSETINHRGGLMTHRNEFPEYIDDKK